MDSYNSTINIVLLEPRIPGNVGTIGRLCYAIDATLHLIKPYGFGDITKKELRRAGLDYWEFLKVFEYEDIQSFWHKHTISNNHYFATTKTDKNYFDVNFSHNTYIYFGREDAGLPQYILEKNQHNCITIPMKNEARSLNLSNSVSIISYEIVRQHTKRLSTI